MTVTEAPELYVHVAAYGRVNHLAEWPNQSLCGVELIRNPDSITAGTLCRRCEAIARKRGWGAEVDEMLPKREGTEE